MLSVRREGNVRRGHVGRSSYVLDEQGDFAVHCNKEMVALETPDEENLEEIRNMIKRHVEYTHSEKGRDILARWAVMSEKFVKVMPKDYKRMLEALKKVQQAGLSGDEASWRRLKRTKTTLPV